MTRAYQLCRTCGHARCCHEHYRPGTDCSALYLIQGGPRRCDCPEFRRRPLLARVAQLVGRVA